MKGKIALEEHIESPDFMATGTHKFTDSSYFEDVDNRLQEYKQPLQDPAAAARELERAVKDLGFVGANINGYTNIGDENTARYLDEAPVWDFWGHVQELNVPVYLHPKIPLPSQQRIFEGYEGLLGSAWGFGFETSTHALRLILSGLFDRYPKLKLILGHLGEALPFTLPRVEHRLRHQTK